ncbi:hypothetical protein CC86DRAFT_5132 [Ophiobolus disseminans]|uniref:Uncharacterized protein n=1 Tax=Ophiobolus disseminans TaxID=1469910 RepID=A0A6A7AIR6_9PLEO|nr:hypothetical protein CC86DRAFT_5132 [Ophiobolus disseminans]
METWANWALFLAIVGAGYLYYSQNQGAVTRGRSTATKPTTASAADTAQWLDSEVKTKAAKAVKVAKAKTKAPRKSVQNAVQEVGNKVEAYLDTASSTAGADADDDLSPVASPTFNTKAPSGRDVSDMLGSQSAAPSVLSIKPVEKPARAAKPQAPKAEAPQESKKARQNRKKVEEAKAIREAEEKQRQALLEKQRRTAREARGEPAKNGIQAGKAPASNAWTTVGSAGAVKAPASAPTSQLLDTFDAASTASSSEAPTNGTAPTPDSLSNSGYNNALSEEEQVKIALEDTSAWETVAKGKKQKKKAPSVEEDGASEERQAAQPVKPVHIDKFVRPALSENKKPSSRYQILQEEFTPGADNADDWPVV